MATLIPKYDQGSTGAANRPFDIKLQERLSVKDFGAVGDGVADDTVAIQAAITAANAMLTTGLSTVTYAAIKAVYFPQGTYKITDSLTLSGYEIIIGDEAVINQATVSEDIFVSGDINISTGAYVSGTAYLITIQGLTFLNGRRHIVLANNNLDSGQFKIESCQFFKSANYALDINVISGQIVIEKCRFQNNYQISRLVNDIKTFNDCWFGSANDTANLGQIVNRGGTLIFNRCLGVTNNAALTSARWVDDYSNSVQAYSCRFGDEGGNGGWPFIYAYGSPDASTRYSPAIVLRDCYASGGGLASGRADASLIYCTYPALDGVKRVPPTIIIDNLTKIQSFAAIGTNMTDGEITTAMGLHTGLSYYSVNNLQFEQYGTYATMPVPFYQRALYRTEAGLQSAAGSNQVIFQQYITQQLLSNLGSSMTIKYSGFVANNAAAKTIALTFNGSTLTSSTYTPATSASTYFNGEIKFVANGLTKLLISHSVIDQTGVKVSNVDNIVSLNLPITEYLFTMNTTGTTLADIQILSLDLNTKV